MNEEFRKLFSHVWALNYQLGDSVSVMLDDYESIVSKDEDLRKRLRGIQWIYVRMIVIELAILIGTSKNDTSGLRQLREVSPESLRDAIDRFLKKHENEIEKIRQNRNRLFVHVDISEKRPFYDLLFPRSFVEKQIRGEEDLHWGIPITEEQKHEIRNRWEKLVAQTPANERYDSEDFLKDIGTYRTLVSELKKIVRDDGMECFVQANPEAATQEK